MAQSSWPDPATGRVVNDRQYELLSARETVDGLYGSPTDTPPVYASGGMQVMVRANLFGGVRGHGWTSGTTDVPLAIDANAAGAARIDRVVLRLDRSAWTVRAAIRKGTAGSGVPALVRQTGDTGVFEVPVAEVTVGSGVSSIASDKVRIGAAWRGGVLRPATVGSDLAGLLAPGDITFEHSTGRYVGWTGSASLTVAEDTGWVSLNTSGATAGPDAAAWVNNAVSRVRRVSGVAHLRIAVRRWADSGLSLADEDGSAPFVLPATFRPGIETFGMGYAPSARQLVVGVAVEPGGIVRLRPCVAALPAGYTVQAAFSWPIG